MSNRNVVSYLNRREFDETGGRHVQKRLHVTESFINRLGLEKELEGHSGCVNCLEWNSSGRMLASASDDFQVILWDPFQYKKLRTVESGHHGNIFSVKFLPESNDRILVTGAADHKVHVHDIEAGEMTQVCTCAQGRIKRIATTPSLPFLFWSASEDGSIRQFDQRSPHTCKLEVTNVLIYLKMHLGPFAEAKCLAINPRRPELIAVGANDPFVRIYDRRMIKLTSIKICESEDTPGTAVDNIPGACVQYFVAGHLPRPSDPTRSLSNLAATYLTFGSNGVDLLVNLGGEQIYLFDITQQRAPLSFNRSKALLVKDPENGHTNGFQNGISATGRDQRKSVLPQHIENMKLIANMMFENKDFPHAIRIYNDAISQFGSSPVLYGNRAAAFMKRDWDGDMYAALRDCLTTLSLDPNHVKAFFRLTRCMLELNWTSEARLCLEAFKLRFPNHASSHACRALNRDITEKATVSSFADNKSEKVEEEEHEIGDGDDYPTGWLNWGTKVSSKELLWRAKAYDYEKRFYGHCNTTTDIKEANFFGSDGEYIVAGSDDGSIYLWERATTNNVRILKGDSSIVNCLQPHPAFCLLATSGIDPVVRLWSPRPEDGQENEREVKEKDDAAASNQRRMKADPFDLVLMNMGYRSTADTNDDNSSGTLDCRTS